MLRLRPADCNAACSSRRVSVHCRSLAANCRMTIAGSAAGNAMSHRSRRDLQRIAFDTQQVTRDDRSLGCDRPARTLSGPSDRSAARLLTSTSERSADTATEEGGPAKCVATFTCPSLLAVASEHSTNTAKSATTDRTAVGTASTRLRSVLDHVSAYIAPQHFIER